jgi:hypothetical protein
MFPEKNNPDKNNDQRKQEHKDGNPVDPMHIFDPPIAWCIGVFFLYVQVFCDLAKHSHRDGVFIKIVNLRHFGMFGRKASCTKNPVAFFLLKTYIFAIPKASA